uniref:EGF-like domain-containing protein n=1 Tax=Plectus sambesii TaxID=2011161 RepID=A0A914X1Q9_9BILA
MGLTCMFGICKCLPHDDDCPGGGRLTSPPGGSCSAQQECTGSSVCREGWCVCPETNMIVTRGICVPATATRPAANLSASDISSFHALPTSVTPSPFVGRKATPGTSCGPLDMCIGGASCIDGMCICPHGTVVAGKRCVNTDKMAKSSKETSAGKPRDSCTDIGLICSGGTVCVGKSCQCPEGTILEGDRCSTGTKSDYARPYESCQNGETCIGGSVCGKEQTCTCPPEKPILRDQECIASNEKPIIRGQENKAAPGEPCIVGTICTGDSMCVQGVCHCQTGYQALQGKCINLPTTTEGVTREGSYALPLMECGPNTQCLGGSICDAISSVCKCPPGSIPLNGVCQAASTFATQAPLGARTTMGRYAGVQIQPPQVAQPECLDDTQCINDKVCIMKQCKCKPGFVEENGVCNLFEDRRSIRRPQTVAEAKAGLKQQGPQRTEQQHVPKSADNYANVCPRGNSPLLLDGTSDLVTCNGMTANCPPGAYCYITGLASEDYFCCRSA